MPNTFNLRLRDERIISLPKPCVMGVINVSPNSFFNPITNFDMALRLAEEMVDAGVSIIDVGGEATNPKVDIPSDLPSVETEIQRVSPLIEAIKKRFDALISVDTNQAKVMCAAVAAGADIINYQRALNVGDALETIAELKVPVCLMHFFNPIRTPGATSNAALLQEIKSDFHHTLLRCEKMGIMRDRLFLDPGFGQGNFGKNAQENFFLLAHLHEFLEYDLPILIGWSRKSMIGEALGGAPVDQRLSGSIASAIIAAMKGAAVIRVHDVKETIDAMQITRLVLAEQKLVASEV